MIRLRLRSVRTATPLLLTSVLGGCTVVGGPIQPVHPSVADETRGPSQSSSEDPRPSDHVPASPSAPARDHASTRITAGVVEVALENLGSPYVWGGTDANGFDCSGLIQYAYGRYGIALPRVSSQQIGTGTPVEPSRASLRPGDILGFSGRPGGKTTHVGLYVGSGDFIHSSSSGVRVSTLENQYWVDRLVAARRIVD